jgi:hypothetical protein
VKDIIVLPNQFDFIDFNCLFNTTMDFYLSSQKCRTLFADDPEVLGSLGILEENK